MKSCCEASTWVFWSSACYWLESWCNEQGADLIGCNHKVGPTLKRATCYPPFWLKSTRWRPCCIQQEWSFCSVCVQNSWLRASTHQESIYWGHWLQQPRNIFWTTFCCESLATVKINAGLIHLIIYSLWTTLHQSATQLAPMAGGMNNNDHLVM